MLLAFAKKAKLQTHMAGHFGGYKNAKRKVIPLQARCGPEGG